MRKISIGLVLLVAFSLTSAMAQKQNARMKHNNFRGDGMREYCINNLSDEQKEALKAERIKFQKEIQDEKNRLNELKAKKHTIQTTEPYDKKAMYACLEEINELMVSIRKQKLRHQQALKSQLNEEQLVRFDQFQGMFGNGRRGEKGMRRNGQMVGRRHRQKGKGQMMARRGQEYHGNGQMQGKRFDQQGKGQRMEMRNRANNSARKPLFTDEQKAEMKEKHLELVKNQQPLRNKMNELKAAYKTQTTGKDINLKKVDALIDQQGDIQLQMAKLNADHRNEIRQGLSDEQKLMCNMRKGRAGRVFHRGRF